MTEQPKRAVIGPVQIVCVEHERLAARDVCKHFRDRVEEEQPFFVWRELVVLGKWTKPRDELRREFRDQRRGIAEQFAQFAVLFLFTGPASKRFDKRQVRSGGFVLVTTAGQDE